jgi:hypothetical protein
MFFAKSAAMFERMIASRERAVASSARRMTAVAGVKSGMKGGEKESERIAMASEKQLRANRENAPRSSGPKTAVGRWRSSRNALRHGLSLPLSADPAASMAQMLVPERADDAQVMARVEVAQAHAQLLRVAAVRSKLMAKLDLASANLKQLRPLAALDRYEPHALTRRRRATRRLSASDGSEKLGSFCQF